jgi:hypothetical protein
MMRLSCAVGRHRGGSRRVRNQGFEFGCCGACGRDLVRSRGSWRAVPKGFRVVWRREAGPQAVLSGAQLLLDLPASGRALALLRAPERGTSRAAAAAELLALGVQYLAWALADRVKAWRKALRAPPMATRPVLCLTAA